MRVIFSILTFLCTAVPAAGQQLPIRNYSPGQNALIGGANSLYQDKNGWLWMTTTYDVIRFDGNEFRIIPLKSNTEMEFCYDIATLDGRPVILAKPDMMIMEDDSLAIFKPSSTLPQIAASLPGINSTYVLVNGALYDWFPETQNLLIDLDSNTFNQGETLVRLNEDILLTYKWKQELIVLDLKNRRYEKSTLAVTALKSWDNQVFALVAGKGIFKIQPDQSGTRYELIVPVPEWKAEYMEKDGSGNFWIGVQDQYLLKVEPAGRKTKYTEAEGLPSLWFTCMLADREGNIWIAFNNGLSKIINTGTQRYTKDQGLFSNHIPAMIHHEEYDRLFVLTTAGVNVIDRNEVFGITEDHRPFVCQFLLAKKNEIYFARDHVLYASAFNSISHVISASQELARFDGNVLNIVDDKDGHLFIATTEGLYVITDHQTKKILDNNTHYHCLLIDHANRLWAGPFSAALEAYQIEYKNKIPNLAPLRVVDGLKGLTDINMIRALVEDKNGNVYAGTRFNGLFKINIAGDRTKIDHWTEKENLKSNSIWGLAIDTMQQCWIASANGVDCLNARNQFIQNADGDASIFQAASIAVTRDNQVWIGSHPGIVKLDLKERPRKPFQTFITSISVNDHPLKWDTTGSTLLRLSHNENNVNISFSANSFTREEEISYSYVLTRKGNESWSIPALNHKVNFSALKPGPYQFKVKARKPSGEWSSNEAEFVFQVLPPFWQTRWFLALIFLILMGAVYAIHRFRIRQLMKLQEVRNTISRDLHDDIGASLSNIHILNILAQRHLQDQDTAKQYLGKASEDIQQISESLSDLVWNINPAHDNADQLVSHMKRYALDMLEGNNIHPNLNFPSQDVKFVLPMSLRRDLFFIFKEAIHNLVKYSSATEAHIDFSIGQLDYHLKIQDNGIGYDEKSIVTGNGLHNMRLRAKRMKSTFTINSVPGQGTSIELRGTIS